MAEDYIAPDTRPQAAPQEYSQAFQGLISTTLRLQRVVALHAYLRRTVQLQEVNVTVRFTVPDVVDQSRVYDIALPIVDAARQASSSPEAASELLKQSTALFEQWIHLEHQRCLQDLRTYTDALVAAAMRNQHVGT